MLPSSKHLIGAYNSSLKEVMLIPMAVTTPDTQVEAYCADV